MISKKDFAEVQHRAAVLEKQKENIQSKVFDSVK
jgi:hypothetical protein